MKMKMKILCALIIIITGCSSEKVKKNIGNTLKNDSAFFKIDFPNIIKNTSNLLLSEIADGIEYISLETTPESLLGRVVDAKLSKEYIFIEHNGHALLTQFNRRGDFVRHIGRVGRGPGEYNQMRYFEIDEKDQLIYIQGNWTSNILIYSFEGLFIKEIKYKGLRDGTASWSRDTLFIQFGEPQNGDEKYVFTERNSIGDTLQYVLNYAKWDGNRSSSETTGYFGRNVFYRLKNRLHFKGWYNDTIYTYDIKNKIIPKFFIDLKHYKLPDELRTEKKTSKQIPSNYYWVGVTESLRYVFIKYATYSLSINNAGGYIIFDKKLKTGKASSNLSERKGIIDDINNGPEFIPEFTNDSLAFSFLSPFELKEYFTESSAPAKTAISPAQNSDLLKFAQSLKEGDNQIIVIVNLHNNIHL